MSSPAWESSFFIPFGGESLERSLYRLDAGAHPNQYALMNGLMEGSGYDSVNEVLHALFSKDGLAEAEAFREAGKSAAERRPLLSTATNLAGTAAKWWLLSRLFGTGMEAFGLMGPAAAAARAGLTFSAAQAIDSAGDLAAGRSDWGEFFKDVEQAGKMGLTTDVLMTALGSILNVLSMRNAPNGQLPLVPVQSTSQSLVPAGGQSGLPELPDIVQGTGMTSSELLGLTGELSANTSNNLVIPLPDGTATSTFSTDWYYTELRNALQMQGTVKEEAEKQARASVERVEESLAHNNAANTLAHDEYDDQIFEGVLEKAKQPGIMKLSEQEEKVIAERTFDEIKRLTGKLDNRATRRWYLAQDAKIPSLVDENLSMLEQAVWSSVLRNQNRTWARDLMFDQEARRWLDYKYPSKSFEELVNYKTTKLSELFGRTVTTEEAIRDIIKTATKTRESVNKELGLK